MEEYSFHPELLEAEPRKKGISAFLRIKNDEDFLPAVIESHIPYFDEIVAVHNQCTDSTPDILRTFAQKYPQKIKLYEYTPHVYPSVSEKHKVTPPNSVHSIVNYYNYALSKTSYKIVTKLDADHLAIIPNLKKATERIRKRGLRNTILWFSGINTIRTQTGEISVYRNDPFVGEMDHWFFPISRKTYFVHHELYEIAQFPPEMKTEYAGILYFHLKHLQKNYGFTDYDPDRPVTPQINEFLRSAKFQPLDTFVREMLRQTNSLPYRTKIRGILRRLPSPVLRLLKRFRIIRWYPWMTIDESRIFHFKKDLPGILSTKSNLHEVTQHALCLREGKDSI